jgi:hypothetical protein
MPILKSLNIRLLLYYYHPRLPASDSSSDSSMSSSASSGLHGCSLTRCRLFTFFDFPLSFFTLSLVGSVTSSKLILHVQCSPIKLIFDVPTKLKSN